MTGLEDFLAHQQALVGVVGIALTGGLMFALRSVPTALWQGVRELVSTTLIIDSDDEAYRHISVWLAREQRAARARRLMLAQAYDYDLGEWGWEITLGAGWHLVSVGGRPVLVHRHIQEADALAKAIGGGRRERLTLVSLGRRHTEIRAIIDQAKAVYEGVGLVQIMFWANGCYQTADRRPARGLDTVFLPLEQKRRLVADIETFAGARETYRRRGVPWRRGYLLEGPPGTGKTTLINVLAAHVGRSIYVLNLNSLLGDNELITAVNAVLSDGVLVIEDIDGVRVSHDRAGPPPVAQAGPGSPGLVQVLSAPEPRGVTLSGLLNALDGVTAREGRILFITSNRPECLDPALLRAGRVDVRERIERLSWREAMDMHQAFRPGRGLDELARVTAGRMPIAAAELQNLLIGLDGADAPACAEAAE